MVECRGAGGGAEALSVGLFLAMPCTGCIISRQLVQMRVPGIASHLWGSHSSIIASGSDTGGSGSGIFPRGEFGGDTSSLSHFSSSE